MGAHTLKIPAWHAACSIMGRRGLEWGLGPAAVSGMKQPDGEPMDGFAAMGEWLWRPPWVFPSGLLLLYKRVVPWGDGTALFVFQAHRDSRPTSTWQGSFDRERCAILLSRPSRQAAGLPLP